MNFFDEFDPRTDDSWMRWQVKNFSRKEVYTGPDTNVRVPAITKVNKTSVKTTPSEKKKATTLDSIVAVTQLVGVLFLAVVLVLLAAWAVVHIYLLLF